MNTPQEHRAHYDPGGASDPQAHEQGHAPDGTSIRSVYATVAALTVVLGLALGAVWGLTRMFSAVPTDAGIRSQQQWEAGPAAETKGMPSVGEVRSRLQARDERLLNRYGWTDEAATTARIPIRAAMELIVEQPHLVAGTGNADGEGSHSHATPQREHQP